MGRRKGMEVQGVPWEPIPGREGIADTSMLTPPKPSAEPSRTVEPGQQDIVIMTAAITEVDFNKHGHVYHQIVCVRKLARKCKRVLQIIGRERGVKVQERHTCTRTMCYVR